MRIDEGKHKQLQYVNIKESFNEVYCVSTDTTVKSLRHTAVED